MALLGAAVVIATMLALNVCFGVAMPTAMPTAMVLPTAVAMGRHLEAKQRQLLAHAFLDGLDLPIAWSKGLDHIALIDLPDAW
eukprot:scaffold73411_cov31-Tisochrysis_lutea.AAC.2